MNIVSKIAGIIVVIALLVMLLTAMVYFIKLIIDDWRDGE